MIDCKQADAFLDLKGQGTLSDADEQALLEHVKTCAPCQMRMDLATMYEDEPTPFAASIAWRRDIENKRAHGKKHTAWRTCAAVAAALLVLVTGAMSVHDNPLLTTPKTKNAPSLNGVNRAAYEEYASDNFATGGAGTGMLTSGVNTAGSTQKIIRTASLTINTLSFETDLETIKQAVLNLGGRVENESLSGDLASDVLRSAYLTLRVPSQNLDAFMTQAQGVLGRVTASSMGTEDVSENYTDLESRLKTQQTKLDRLNELLAQATQVSDLIEIESAISDAQYMVDYYTGQINGMDSRVSESSVHVILNEETAREAADAAGTGLLSRVQNGLNASLQIVKTFLSDAAVFLMIAAPWLIALAIIAGVVLVIVKKRRKK